MADWKGQRGTRQERGYDADWVRLRNNYIKHNPLCEQRGVGCTGAARIVHHILPVHVRPDLRLDRSNLQAVCDTCHRNIHEERVPGVIVAVCGAPGSGKRAHIEGARKDGELVWDWDTIQQAIGLPEAEHVRRGIYWLLHDWRASFVARVRSGTISNTMWLTITSPEAACSFADQVICMPATPEECKAELGRRWAGEQLTRLSALVDSWFNEFEPWSGWDGPPRLKPGGGSLRTL